MPNPGFKGPSMPGMNSGPKALTAAPTIKALPSGSARKAITAGSAPKSPTATSTIKALPSAPAPKAITAGPALNKGFNMRMPSRGVVNNHPGAAGKGLNKPTPTPSSGSGPGANLAKPNAGQGQPQPGANLAKPNAGQGPGAPPASPPPPPGTGGNPASPPPPSGRPTINITNQVINQVNNTQINNHNVTNNNITINNPAPAAKGGDAGKRDWVQIAKTLVDESANIAKSGLNLMDKTYGAGIKVTETAAK